MARLAGWDGWMDGWMDGQADRAGSREEQQKLSLVTLASLKLNTMVRHACNRLQGDGHQ